MITNTCQAITFTCISIQKKEEFTVDWISIEGPSGSCVLLPNHMPLVSVIKEKGRISYKISQESSVKNIVAKSGMFIFTNNKAILLLDT